MTATAERVLEEIKTLPPPDLRVVWERLTQLVNPGDPAAPSVAAPPFDRAKGQAALDALDGKFTGGRMLQLLLESRAEDRLREQVESETYLATRRPPGHAQT